MPSGYWKNKDNQRRFLDEMGRKLEVKQPSEWGKVSSKLLKGSSVIRMYNNSPIRMLQAVYPGNNGIFNSLLTFTKH